MRRDPLAKEGFLEGNRQRWAVVLLLCAAAVLVADTKADHLDPEPYLSFLTMVGCVFLAGLSLSDYAKTKANTPQDPRPRWRGYHDWDERDL